MFRTPSWSSHYRRIPVNFNAIFQYIDQSSSIFISSKSFLRHWRWRCFKQQYVLLDRVINFIRSSIWLFWRICTLRTHHVIWEISKLFLRTNYLNTMVRAVGYDDGIVRANREASRPGKASGFAPPHPELEQLPPLQQVVTPPAIAVKFQQPFPYMKISYCLFTSV